MHNKKIFFSLLIISSLFTAIATEEPVQDFDETIFNWSRTFAQVMDITHKKHYKITDPTKNMNKAINGFVETLDAHSSFLDSKTYKEMLEMTAGEFFGVGIMIDNLRKSKEKFLTIVDVILNGPADKAGILPMDKIIEVNGQLLEGLKTEMIIAQLKGERGSIVKVKIMRENSPDLLTFDIVRDIIADQHSFNFHIKNHNISYLSLSMFTQSAAKQIAQLLEKSQKKQYKGLILDLRNNSGGLLNSAIDIAGLFLKKKSLVTMTKDKNNKEIDRYFTDREPIAKSSLPIFILINNYTASAAEILAGCLKINSDTTNDYLAFLVGTKTFGKGSVQEIIPISNDCALKITTCLYFLPDNTTIQGTGITPDFIVERMLPPTEQMQWFTKNFGREESLENYIKINKDGSCPSATQQEEKKEVPAQSAKKSNRRHDRAKEMLQADNQLRDCITLINILHTAQTYTPQLVKTRADALSYLKKNHISTDRLEIEEMEE